MSYEYSISVTIQRKLCDFLQFVSLYQFLITSITPFSNTLSFRRP
jgi:hypothetical protein